jgi:hypothetical protein
MRKVTKVARILTLTLSAHWPATVLAGHPLLTEDTGTQGAGRYQLELTHDLSHTTDTDIKTRGQSFNVVLSFGLTESLDVIADLPHERLTERMSTTSTTLEGFADTKIAAKWRFYEEGALSFALRPGIGLPTGNEDKGLGTGHIVPNLFAVTTYASDPWAFHLHLGYTHNSHNEPEERSHIYHASVAVEYSVSEQLRLVSDASIESNAERSDHPHVGSVVLGFVYSVTPDFDLDLGYRKGLTEPALDYAWLTGLALRF